MPPPRPIIIPRKGSVCREVGGVGVGELRAQSPEAWVCIPAPDFAQGTSPNLSFSIYRVGVIIEPTPRVVLSVG